MDLRRIVSRRPLLAALIFEGMLIPLALVLAVLLGISPWLAVRYSPEVVLAGMLATVPLLGALALAAAVRPGWFREIDARVRELIQLLFRGRGLGPILLVSALAGLGEELLFRGVLQAWLAGLVGPWAGLVLASILFGLAHCVTRAYFLLATAMGLYLGAIYQATGNLLLPTLVHGLYDAVAIVYLLRAPADDDEDRVAG